MDSYRLCLYCTAWLTGLEVLYDGVVSQFIGLASICVPWGMTEQTISLSKAPDLILADTAAVVCVCVCVCVRARMCV